jgi:pimeloyl-ACP methyl ester carboxylesterase
VIVLFVAAAWGLAACDTFFVARHKKAEHIARQAAWEYHPIEAPPFRLAAWVSPRHRASETLIIYIEGDGLAFLGSRTVSPDPTPDDPLALRLAVSHSGGGVAYLARPCQYVGGPSCSPAYWTSRRYSPEVVAAFATAIDELERITGAGRVVLVGYSGGGAIAALVAARRSDVAGLVTVAGNLDIAYWVRRDGLTPLAGSLDPADAPLALPQVHFVGGNDDVVGPDVVRSYLRRTGAPPAARVVEENRFDHACCWAEAWPRLSRHHTLSAIPGWTGGKVPTISSRKESEE